ncbi:DUF4145 domain-containing protein [Tenacibaculum sp.]|uniref:DUF4145 domain-containing protein n=1 Tax=Tenacibaculum sp. TaxID=1906242 RepID=UPI003AA7BC7A
MKRKVFCQNCKGLRNHSEIKSIEKRGSDIDNYFQWINKYLIVECKGCENISFLHIYGDNEMYNIDDLGNQEFYDIEKVYPYYLEKNNEIESTHLFPKKIKIIYSETIKAFKAGSYILTAGGLRAIIEALCNYLKIRKDSLEERINLLHKKGHLTVSESKRLHSIRFLGNDALHEIEIPKKQHLSILLEIINHLLTNLFINDQKIQGEMETIIDNYTDFIKLLKNKITPEMKDKKLTLNEILGKSKRLLPKGKLDQFNSQLIIDLGNKKHSFIEFKSDKYKIIEVPYFFDL